MTVKHALNFLSLFIPTRNTSELQSSNSHICNLEYSICYRTNSVELDNVQSAKHVNCNYILTSPEDFPFEAYFYLVSQRIQPLADKWNFSMDLKNSSSSSNTASTFSS